MGETTNISWTEKTYNPWQGCSKVSPGCAHCYMFRDKKKYGQDPSVVVRSKDPTFYKALKWEEEAVKDGRQILVFTCSWSDFFHEVADPWRAEAWDVIRRTPHLTYQILTKRPERIADCLPPDWGTGWPNVWMGTSVENQHFANIRIPILLKVPAVVRFLSCEPLLGPLDLREVVAYKSAISVTTINVLLGTKSTIGVSADVDVWPPREPRIHWVIVGGESGPMFRRMQVEWARDLRDQCLTCDTAFFFKQSSGMRPETNPYLDGRQWHEMPEIAA